MRATAIAAAVAFLFSTTSVYVTAQVPSSAPNVGKVQPPSPIGRDPAFYIYQDVDYISYPNGNLTSCPALKALRSKCYNTGLQEKSYAAEQKCLCSPDTAYQVVQCFYKNYRAMTDQAMKANYYEDFLTYTYDCYCGVEPVDVTYNRTATPVVPYIKGYTGDPILPPVGGCPAKTQPGGDVCPVPPCNCPPVQKPPKTSCPDGLKRVYDKCIPDCPPGNECKEPKVVDKDGNCVCAYGTVPVGPDGCAFPPCPDPNEIRVITPRGSYCVCRGGYVYDNNNKCVTCCPPGQTRDSSGVCKNDCEPPRILDYSGKCVCPLTYGYEEVNGKCQPIVCKPNQIWSNYGYCFCSYPNYEDAAGNCLVPKCSENVESCSPGCPGLLTAVTTIMNITSLPPDFSSYVPTTTYNISAYTDTASTLAVPTDTVAPLTTSVSVETTVDTTLVPVTEETATGTDVATATDGPDSGGSSTGTDASPTGDSSSPTTLSDSGSSSDAGPTLPDSGSSSDAGPTGAPGGGDSGTAPPSEPTGGSSDGAGSSDGSSGGGGAPTNEPAGPTSNEAPPTPTGGGSGGEQEAGGEGSSPTARVRARYMQRWL